MPQLKGRHQTSLALTNHVEGRVRECADPETIRRRAIYDALAEMTSVIYAIRTEDNLIKIGYTGSLRERRRNHGVGFTDILAVRAGTYEEEQALHQRFLSHLARGKEYYHPNPEIMSFVNGIREAAGVPAC